MSGKNTEKTKEMKKNEAKTEESKTKQIPSKVPTSDA